MATLNVSASPSASEAESRPNAVVSSLVVAEPPADVGSLLTSVTAMRKALVDHLKEIAPEVELTPGMPADVLIVTGERSALRYIFEPIERSFRMSFRQS